MHTHLHIYTYIGTWVSSNKNDIPKDIKFIKSKNTFEMKSIKNIEKNKNEWKGWYLLDNGEGLEKYKDVKHVFDYSKLYNDISSSSSSINSSIRKEDIEYVGACGKTEFGNFISTGMIIHKITTSNTAGTYVAEGGVGGDEKILILVRRYVGIYMCIFLYLALFYCSS